MMQFPARLFTMRTMPGTILQGDNMKYLIQHKKEFAITVAAFVMAVINLVRAIKSHEVTEELIVAVLVTGTTILAWYYNMPTSEENCKHTGEMRLEKEQNAGIIHGEDFTDEPEEDEEEDGDGLDPDEADADDIDDGPNDADPDDEEVL